MFHTFLWTIGKEEEGEAKDILRFSEVWGFYLSLEMRERHEWLGGPEHGRHWIGRMESTGISKWQPLWSCRSIDSSSTCQVLHGVCYASEQAERKIKRHRYDTITEGVGIDRLTANFQEAQIDDAYRVSDKETVEMAHYLLKKEGKWRGPFFQHVLLFRFSCCSSC